MEKYSLAKLIFLPFELIEKYSLAKLIFLPFELIGFELRVFFLS